MGIAWTISINGAAYSYAVSIPAYVVLGLAGMAVAALLWVARR